MIILGITDTHDASACLIKDGRLIMAVAEERLQRVKNISSFPRKSIEHIFKTLEYKYSDIDHVAVATKNVTHLNFWNVVSDFSNNDWLKLHNDYYFPLIYKNKKIKIKNIFPKYKPSTKMGYPCNKIPFVTNEEASGKDLKNLQILRKKYISRFLNIDKNKIKFYDHHICHALYAYYTNSNNLRKKRVAIVTSDSGGDGIYNTVSIIDNGKYKELSRSKNNLIGKIYETTTLLLGMNPARHLYKVMGLAPYASERYKKGPRDIFLNSLKVNKLDFKKDIKMKDHFFYFKKRLENFRFDGIAGGLQDFVEIRLVEWFKNISKIGKTHNFIFSGGVANNVKANKILIEQNFVKSFFVPPGPGDESLSIGSAYAALVNFYGMENLNNYIQPATNAYWGSNINLQEQKKFNNHPYIKKNFNFFKDKSLTRTAKVLAKGEIVLFCLGRMEFGQRAMGHRSILSNPSKFEQIKKINDTIKKRDFWMPFTPSILEENFKKYIVNPKEIQSDYMTVCFDSTKLAKKHFKAAIHPYDFTIRPQKVSKKTCPEYYKLLKKFKKLTGIGGLLNTSLNVHDKPIIYQPSGIIKEILRGDLRNINHIFIQDTLYIKK